MLEFENLESKKVFEYFYEISSIPRGSGNTKAISDYVVGFAKVHGLEYLQDETNNVIIKKKATIGRENDAGVILQGHLDMVAEKTLDSNHDFLKDGLCLYVEGDFLKAKDTTLGGDDGIAIAYALAILGSDDISHPNLEAIFTVDEETGMDGARSVDMSQIEGKYLLNIDNEKEGEFVVGCAGGAKVKCNIPSRKCITEGIKCSLKVTGLLGGHSGIEIDKERANANIIMGRVLNEIAKEYSIDLIDICGGNMDNAIPIECKASIVVMEQDVDNIKGIVKEQNAILKNEYFVSDKDIEVQICIENKGTHKVVFTEDFENILYFLNSVPNGVMNMNMNVKGLVETSLNIGILYLEDDCMSAVTAVRSSVKSRKYNVINTIQSIVEKAEGFIEVRGEYPEWSYKEDSKLREKIEGLYEAMYGKKPEFNIIHAGLECGYLLTKRPELDIISFGPNIYDIHTTKERMSISSVENVYKFIIEFLKSTD